MEINFLNFDDIIRAQYPKKELHWGTDGLQAFKEIYGEKVKDGFVLFGVSNFFDGKEGEVY